MNTTWPVAQQLTSAPSRPSRVRGSAPRPDDHVIVVFGATGDLARRKLLPGLFHLAAADLIPDRYQIIGSSRRSLADGSQDRRRIGPGPVAGHVGFATRLRQSPEAGFRPARDRR